MASYFKPKFYTPAMAPSTSLDIGQLPWTNLSDLELEKASPERKSLLSKFTGGYVLPQLMAWFASPAVTLVKNATGKYSVHDTIRALGAKSKAGDLYFSNGVPVNPTALKGILRFMTRTSRSEILPITIKRQTDPNGLRWAANVPLFFSAYKELRDIPYSAWDLQEDGLEYVFHSSMVELLKSMDPEFVFSAEDLAQFSVMGRTFKTGAKAGTVRELENHAPPRFSESDRAQNPLVEVFEQYGNLTRQLILQLWIFRPQFYNKYGIFSLTDIDGPAENAPTIDIMAKPEATQEVTPQSKNSSFDWD